MIFLIFLLSLCIHASYSVNCKNEKNEDVDWFIIYKIPKLEYSEDVILKEGHGYVYLDNTNTQWLYPQKDIKESNNALAFTMTQLYENTNDKDFMRMSYNDASPDGQEHFDFGHTKGVLMSNVTNGVWLVHSLPRFPISVQESSHYFYPPNGAWNGQIFLCISIDHAQLLNISQLIYYDTPYIHDKYIPESFMDENSYFRWLNQNEDVVSNKSAPWTLNNLFTSLWTKTVFTGFAKYKRFNADIYTNILAPFYDADLLTETWQVDKRHILNSSCIKIPRVENIKGISFSHSHLDMNSRHPYNLPSNLDAIHFSELIDHSKWTITASSGSVVCVGDLNREITQAKRSGGMVCIDNPNLWESFKQIISDIEACPLPLDDIIVNNSV
ncbi:plancitoxin-1-like isoform X2 [Gordionus sp. m RMFG-2023]|uniref:plancitoxin-1-like isoform X2 n=1 Tax=Gordionus sp. m RMFG-2023 TaxID=3053472 RepID=UPI0031FC7393